MDQLVEKEAGRRLCQKGTGIPEGPIPSTQGRAAQQPLFPQGFILPFLDDYEGHPEPERVWRDVRLRERSQKSGQMANGRCWWLCPFLRKSVRTGRTKNH